MEKAHRNWYIFIASDLFFSWLFMLTLFIILDLPTHYAGPIVLDLIGVFLVLHAILYKHQYIEYPKYMNFEKISDDEEINREYHYYADLFTGVLYLLGSAYCWIIDYGAGLRLGFMIAMLRASAYYYLKSFTNNI